METPQQPTESFSYHLVQGEALTVGTRITTPRGVAYLITASEEPLTPDTMREWFKQSAVPLVGQKAADTLDSLIKEGTRGSDFLNQAIEFRKQYFSKR